MNTALIPNIYLAKQVCNAFVFKKLLYCRSHMSADYIQVSRVAQ